MGRVNPILGCLKEFWWFKGAFIMIATPILLAIMLPFYKEMGLSQKACNCLYMLLLMAVYWCTDTVPLAVTSLIPLVLAPLLSIQNADAVARSYLKDLNVMFMGGLMVATVIEHTQLHRRIALSVLRLVGTNPRFLMLGFMIPSWFLSMWISNTATTAMMIPIVQAVISQLSSKDLAEHLENGDIEMNGDSNGAANNAFEGISSDVPIETSDSISEVETTPGGMETNLAKTKWRNTSIALSLCVCYAATCGGIATVTGTAPNLVLGENVNRVSKDLGDYPFGLDFASWMGFGLPVSLTMMLLAWICLQIFFIEFRGQKQTSAEKAQIKIVVKRAYDDLGTIKFREVMALIHFILLALLWISRNPGGIGGWGSLFPIGYATDATAAMFVVVLLFLWPDEIPDLCCFRGGCAAKKAKHRAPLITWDVLSKNVPWGLIFLLGGGFALADSISLRATCGVLSTVLRYSVSKLNFGVSGLSNAIGERLNFFEGWPKWCVVMCLSAITASITEITSNTAISTIFLPIVANVALDLKINPMYLMLPVTASASFAFMLPVATPPNALVFATEVLTIKDMAKAGFALKILGILVITLATMTWGNALFKIDQFDYFSGNMTANFTLTEAVISGGH